MIKKAHLALHAQKLECQGTRGHRKTTQMSTSFQRKASNTQHYLMVTATSLVDKTASVLEKKGHRYSLTNCCVSNYKLGAVDSRNVGNELIGLRRAYTVEEWQRGQCKLFLITPTTDTNEDSRFWETKLQRFIKRTIS